MPSKAGGRVTMSKAGGSPSFDIVEHRRTQKAQLNGGSERCSLCFPSRRLCCLLCAMPVRAFLPPPPDCKARAHGSERSLPPAAALRRE